ncbi:hypothetical protein [Algibacter pectinivorans]|uniref:Uncharacterized protein n=1 Tax=Algibacter pectinivorans TaxID=870482 RepID=A0A1I1RED2_9FLAO|nr:hypothetical protein [Algibacter pectinivorans]SFD28750.1 hypothetical protein SAMN04487987_108111 [Algibacter pectinivorans]
MKYTYYIFIFFFVSISAQESVAIKFIDSVNLKTETLISVDNFNTVFYVNNNILHKKTDTKTITYNNLQLGNLSIVNTFNPLKINLFYNDFNTVVVLDNRLAEVFKIDFNTLSPYKNVSHISTGYDNTLWIFNQDLQKLELFDYKTKTTRAQTTPVQSEVLDIKSNYNFCWLLTKNYLYTYNYFGSLVKKIKNTGYTTLTESNENIILKSENTLFYIPKDNDVKIPIDTSNLLINQFFVVNETLYIYSNNVLSKYQLKIL